MISKINLCIYVFKRYSKLIKRFIVPLANVLKYPEHNNVSLWYIKNIVTKVKLSINNKKNYKIQSP